MWSRHGDTELITVLKKVRYILKENGWAPVDVEDYELDDPMTLSSAIEVACKTTYHYSGGRSLSQQADDQRQWFAVLEVLASRLPIVVADLPLLPQHIQAFDEAEDTTEQDVFDLLDYCLCEVGEPVKLDA